MDRALQERIVGAAVLVLVMVLVVPVFLDGPGLLACTVFWVLGPENNTWSL